MQTASSDRAAEFIELFAQNSQRIYAYIHLLVPLKADADDIFQETSRVLWEKFSEFESGTNFRAWACSIAHFKVLQFRRNRSATGLALGGQLEELLDPASLTAIDSLDSRLLALHACLDRLSQTDRELIHLRYHMGIATNSIAEQQSRSSKAVYRALARVHQLLFECIRTQLKQESAL